MPPSGSCPNGVGVADEMCVSDDLDGRLRGPPLLRARAGGGVCGAASLAEPFAERRRRELLASRPCRCRQGERGSCLVRRRG